MANNNDLFEGIQIMTPQELESSMGSGETNANDDNNNTIPKEDSGFEITNPASEKPVTDDSNSDSNIDTNVNVDINVLNDKKADKDTNISSTQTNEDVYKALISEMVSAGALSVEEGDNLEELPGNLDTIRSLMEKTVEKNTTAKQDKWKSGLSKSKKRFLEIEDAFDEEDTAMQMAERLEFFDGLTTEALSENADLQKQIYFQYLKSKGFTDADATDQVSDADALDKLGDKAASALPQLKKEATDFVTNARTTKTAATEANKTKATETFNSLMTSIDSRESFIDGINLNKIGRDKLKENITKPVHTDDDGREYTSLMFKQKNNPSEFEMLINYYDSIGMFNTDKAGKFKPDVSKLKNVAKTKAVNEIDRAISNSAKRGVGRNTSVESSKTTEGLLGALEGAFSKKK
jgi:hypothetical protein